MSSLEGDLVYMDMRTPARLYLGGETALRYLDHHGIEAVALVADNCQPELPASLTVMRAPFRDIISTDQAEIDNIKWSANSTADWVLNRMKDGMRVLVACKSGLNRSGLVAALVLKRKLKVTASQAIDSLRESRSVWVLNNTLFEKLAADL
jgi:hypothetical protein